jgi:CcmD family protein
MAMTSNYTVLAVTLIIWVGIFVYLVMLDRKTKKLEEKK